MKEWLQKNWWSVIIALITISSTYTMYGYRLGELEKKAEAQQVEITALQNSSNDTAVGLARIQKDIEYIRLQVDRIVKQ